MNVFGCDTEFGGRHFFDDEKMFEFAFKAYFPRVMAFTMKFISDKGIAEDIVQEVFLKLWIKRKEVKEETFQSYLFTFVRNACLNHIKHQKIVEEYQSELKDTVKEEGLYYADFFSDPLQQAIYNETKNEIETFIGELPEQTRKIFQLSRFEGLKNIEIAKKMNISLRTVEKHNTKALQKLKVRFAVHSLYAIALLDILKELPLSRF